MYVGVCLCVYMYVYMSINIRNIMSVNDNIALPPGG